MSKAAKNNSKPKMTKDQLRNAISQSVKNFKAGHKPSEQGIVVGSQQPKAEANLKTVRKHLRKV